MATPFDQVGGEPAVQALVERFYDLMDMEAAYAELRAAHGNVLDDARHKLFWFLREAFFKTADSMRNHSETEGP